MTALDLKAFHNEALRQERVEIARMLEAEAQKHIDAAAELERDYDNASEEIACHRADEALLHRMADLVLARTPAVESAPEEEILFLTASPQQG